MSRFHSYVLSAKKILNEYKGAQPFPYHLKQFFSANKKYGSKDRKLVAECCYAWLRCAHLFKQDCTETPIIQSLFLCSPHSNTLLENLDSALNAAAGLLPADKLNMLSLDADALFPFWDETGEINKKDFALSFLHQPNLFLRARPGKEKTVLNKLQNNAAFLTHDKDCFELINAAKAHEIIILNKEAVVQDKNSQKVFDTLAALPLPDNIPDVWDCCAASGGKSILLQDKLKKKLRLTVSDIRPTMLHNCKVRLQQAGVNIHHAFSADLSKPVAGELLQTFDIIICDAPCTGSGTWSRTPEQLAFFNPVKIDEFSKLQIKIATNIIPHLKKQGLLVYITCSVFEKENERVVEEIQHTSPLTLLESAYLRGYNDKADTMYVALFKN